MVQSVSGSLLPAVFAGSAAARNLAQQNLVLPSPLPSPQELAQQRASPILRFNAPTLSSDILAGLQDGALRAQVRPETTATSNTAAVAGDTASRAAQAYGEAARLVQPLVALGTAPSAVPNLQALVLSPRPADAGETRTAEMRTGRQGEAETRRQPAGNDEAPGRRNARDTLAGTQQRDNPLLPPRESFPAGIALNPANAGSGRGLGTGAGSSAAAGIGANLGLRLDLGA